VRARARVCVHVHVYVPAWCVCVCVFNKESCLVSTWMVWVMNRANKAAAGLSLPITRCFKSCTRLGVSDRSDAKPAQPADREKERERERATACAVPIGWMDGLALELCGTSV
jgi:hypothetical protein